MAFKDKTSCLWDVQASQTSVGKIKTHVITKNAHASFKFRMRILIACEFYFSHARFKNSHAEFGFRITFIIMRITTRICACGFKISHARLTVSHANLHMWACDKKNFLSYSFSRHAKNNDFTCEKHYFSHAPFINSHANF